jgi:hypothetical protein
MLLPPKKTSKPAGRINPPWLIQAWRVFSWHPYKSKPRRDTVLLKKFYRLHINHMLRTKISFAPCLTYNQPLGCRILVA